MTRLNIRKLRTIGLIKKYKKGQMVTARPGSQGILCFEERDQAKKFALGWRDRIGCYRILEVEGYDVMDSPKICSFNPEIWDQILETGYPSGWTYAPLGTIAFRQVKVLT